MSTIVMAVVGRVVWLGDWAYDITARLHELGRRLQSALTSGNESGGLEVKTAGVDILEEDEGK